MNRFRPPVNLRERGPSGRGFLVKIAKLSPACSLACGLGLALACFVPYYIRYKPNIIRYKTRYIHPREAFVVSGGVIRSFLRALGFCFFCFFFFFSLFFFFFFFFFFFCFFFFFLSFFFFYLWSFLYNF